jgi:hypothetical protein
VADLWLLLLLLQLLLLLLLLHEVNHGSGSRAARVVLPSHVRTKLLLALLLLLLQVGAHILMRLELLRRERVAEGHLRS